MFMFETVSDKKNTKTKQNKKKTIKEKKSTLRLKKTFCDYHQASFGPTF